MTRIKSNICIKSNISYQIEYVYDMYQIEYIYDLYQIEFVKRRSNRIRKETELTFKKFCHHVVPVELNIELI